jgi:hypothetical protein
MPICFMCVLLDFTTFVSICVCFFRTLTFPTKINLVGVQKVLFDVRQVISLKPLKTEDSNWWHMKALTIKILLKIKKCTLLTILVV